MTLNQMNRTFLGAALLSVSTLATAQGYEFRMPLSGVNFPTPQTPVEAWTEFLTDNGLAVPSDWGNMFAMLSGTPGDMPAAPYPATHINAAGFGLILKNTDTTDLGGLSVITSMAGGVDIADVPLTSLSVFQGVTHNESVVRISNTNITNLNDFSSMTHTQSTLYFLSNTMLGNINGLSGITTLGGDFLLRDSPIANVNGLSGLTTASGDFGLRDLNSLTSLAGLSSLTSVGSNLFIMDNGLLMSLAGLDNLTHVGGQIHVKGYPSGFDATALGNITSGLGSDAIRIDAGYDGPLVSSTAYICQAGNSHFWQASWANATQAEVCAP